MGLVDDTRVKLLLAGLLLSVFALVGVVAFGLLSVASAVLAPPAGTPILLALLNAIIPYALAATLFGGLTLVFLLWLLLATVRRASLPRDDRLAGVARRVERHVPPAREVGLSERMEPSTEDRIEDLKERYVEGEITELEYERRLQDLLREEDVDDARVTDDRIERELDRLRREHDRTMSQSEYEFER